MAENLATKTSITSSVKNSSASAKAQERAWKTFSYAALIFGATISLIPFAWMILKSMMTLGESLSATIIPTEWHPENLVQAWQEAEFSRYMVNSVVITLITLSGELAGMCCYLPC